MISKKLEKEYLIVWINLRFNFSATIKILYFTTEAINEYLPIILKRNFDIVENMTTALCINVFFVL